MSNAKFPDVIEDEVLVVGAGPLGIVTALELADRGRRVTLLESGEMHHDAFAQELSEASEANSDPFSAAKSVSVRRQFGGTSALWGGRCVPFDPIDFEPRPYLPEDLWPIKYSDVEPHLERACQWAACGRPEFDATRIAELSGHHLVPGWQDGDVRATELERWALPTRFGPEYRQRVESHPKLRLLTGLTCVEVFLSEDGAEVSHLLLRSSDGAVVTARAQDYVLAAGGLETTRLLLVSDRHASGGIGNHSGHLGRWYMAHVEARVGEVHFSTPPADTQITHERDRDGVYVRRRFSIPARVQREAAVPNAVVWPVNADLADHTHGSGILSGVYLTLTSPLGKYLLADAIREAGTKAKKPTSRLAHVANVARDFRSSLAFAISFSWARFLRRGRKAPGFFVRSDANRYPLHFHGEHLPHWESYVELADDRDSLGMRRLRSHLYFSDVDVSSVRSVLDRIDAHLRRAGIGQIAYYDDDVEGLVREYLAGSQGFHQTGTTRMSSRPEDGVVDADLQVHGVRNLFISSTSVLPTSSQANPTLTGIALAVRLAAHLAARGRA